MKPTNSNAAQIDPFADADVISTYTRAEGIADGMLVDVSEVATEAGIRFPVAMTRAAFEDVVTWTRTDVHQDESGRLWDVLWMCMNAMRRAKGDRLLFQLVRIPNTGRGRQPRLVTLRAVCGPGDTAEPVVTILLPEES